MMLDLPPIAHDFLNSLPYRRGPAVYLGRY